MEERRKRAIQESGLDKATIEKVQNFMDNNPPKVEWNYYTAEPSIAWDMVKNGRECFDDHIFENASDWAFDELRSYVNAMIERFELDLDIDEFEAIFSLPDVDFNFKGACEYIGKIAVYLAGHSNFDCTNSFDNLEEELKQGEGYLGDIYGRVKKAITKEDFAWEHANGAYGGSLFIFVMKMDVLDFVNLREKWNGIDRIVLGKGTQFGFYSSFQGSASVFEKTLNKDIELELRPNNYDYWSLYYDGERGYSLEGIFGCTDWIEENYIKAI